MEAEREIAAHEEFLAGHTQRDALHVEKNEELLTAKNKWAGILIEEKKARAQSDRSAAAI